VARATFQRAVEAFLVIAAVVVSLTPLTAGTAYLRLSDPVHGILGAHRLGRLLETNLIVEGVPGNATVYWDRHGIPYIYASTDAAAMYALGWVEAGLRLFQMDLYRRIPEARLAELIGPQGLDSDRVVLSLGLPGAVRASAERALNDPRFSQMNALIGYFLLGVNDYVHYINSHGLLPAEYALLGLKPEPWNYTDVIAVSKLLALLYSFSDSDLVNAEIASKLGPQAIALLGVPGAQYSPPTASCNESTPWRPFHAVPLAPPRPWSPPPNPEAALAELSGLHVTLGSLASGYPASTGIVVSPAYSRGKAPILAVDLHGSLTVPAMWMPAVVVSPSIRVAGLFLPGMPFPVAGRTPRAAWGVMSSGIDQVDYYYFKWSPDGRYYYNGTWRSVESREAAIRYWDPLHHSMKSERIVVNETIVGPLISWRGGRYAVAWTGLSPSVDIAFFWAASSAASVRDILRAQIYAGTPAFLVVAADRDSNIVASAVGSIPIRRPALIRAGNETIVNTGFLPFNASAGEGSWTGFAPKTETPILLNPRRPYILVSSNILLSGSCANYTGYEYWGAPRYARLREVLDGLTSRPHPMSAGDVAQAILDTKDLGLLNATRLLVSLASKTGLSLGARERSALDMLASWDGSTRRGLGTPQQALALAWWSLFTSKLWSRLGVNFTDPLMEFQYTLQLLDAYAAGDARARGILHPGYPEELAAETLREALDTLERYYGTGDMAQWDYGLLHYFHPAHPLGWILPGLNLRREPAPGGPESPYTAAASLLGAREGAPVRVASTARLVVDLSEEGLLVSIPGGVSGNPFDAHYRDLYLPWARGELVEVDPANPPRGAATLTITGAASQEPGG